jgi:hypothetical protein
MGQFRAIVTYQACAGMKKPGCASTAGLLADAAIRRPVNEADYFALATIVSNGL